MTGSQRARTPLAPGSTIGIMGGGQLGRMAALAAAALGYRVHVFAPDADGPAAEVSATATVAAYDDEAALTRFADAVDVVTFEFENIPAPSVALLAERVAVRPSWTVLDTAQDRLTEKQFINDAGIGTAPFAPVDDEDSLKAAWERIGAPSVLKTRRMGYDGKGQVMLKAGEASSLGDLAAAWEQLGRASSILEGFVDFEREISVIVARSPSGETASFEPVDNIHEHHILKFTDAPSTVPAAVAREAERVALRIADAIALEGMLAVEMFVTRDGKVLVNELAPRPHNSGHWTIDACVTSQFEQFIRAVCDLPLGNPARLVDARMENLLGDDIERWAGILAEPNAKLHLYGKGEARPGRKMGHVTRLKPGK